LRLLLKASYVTASLFICIFSVKLMYLDLISDNRVMLDLII
jgi:hypothetical protein